MIPSSPSLPAPPLFTLQFGADLLFAPPLSALVADLARRHHLGEERAGQLSLAGEELVAYLAPLLPGQTITATLAPTATGLALRFTFPDRAIDLRHLNLATDRSQFGTDSGELAGLGLYLAARMVDAFSVEFGPGRAEIALHHDRVFAVVTPVPPPAACTGPVAPAPVLTDDLLGLACAHTLAAEPEASEPLVKTPARLAALIGAGGHDAVVATDSAGRVAGWIYWTMPTPRSARFFGPYVFGGVREPTARLLCEAMFTRLGRTTVQMVCEGRATAATPPELFEQLRFPGAGEPARLLRQLQEDSGGVSRCPAAFRSALGRLYHELVLVRDIVPAPELPSAGASVLGTELDRDNAEATLRPLVAGADLPANLAAHVGLLRREGIRRIVARCDLGHGWQAAAAGVFQAAGFVLSGLEPGAGTGDILVLAHHG